VTYLRRYGPVCFGIVLAGTAGGAFAAESLEPPGDPAPRVEVIQTIVEGLLNGVVSASSTVEQELVGNTVQEGNLPTSVSFQDGLSSSSGIFSINQNAGNLNNQVNVRAIALSMSSSSIQQLSLDASATTTDNLLTISGNERMTQVSGSFENTTGIVGLTQSAGNLNQQANLLVLGVGLTPEELPTLWAISISEQPTLLVLGVGFTPEEQPLLLTDNSLGEMTGNNSIDGPIGSRSDSLTDSFGGFKGIAQVSQSSGDVNIIRNALEISVQGIPGT